MKCIMHLCTDLSNEPSKKTVNRKPHESGGERDKCTILGVRKLRGLIYHKPGVLLTQKQSHAGLMPAI